MSREINHAMNDGGVTTEFARDGEFPRIMIKTMDISFQSNIIGDESLLNFGAKFQR